MKRAGVRVEEFHPIRPWEGRFSWRPINRDHRKLLLIDDDIAWLGGLNIGAEYAGSWIVQPSPGAASDFWRDNAIGLHGPSAKYFLEAFIKTWRYIQHGGRLRNMQYIHGIDLRDSAPSDRYEVRGVRNRRLSRYGIGDTPLVPDLGILASVATMDSPLRPLLHRLLSRANQSIQLTMAYFAPDDDLIETLCKSAKRGVKVQLMLPGRGDVHALITAARSFYETLLSCGVEVFERQGCVLHAKTMVVDSCISVVGSTNLDYRSIEYNCELSAIIRNETFGRQMNDLFANDILYARRISLREWRRRPLRDKFVQWLVNRARYLL
jgi:cardiolipin synthase